MAFGADPRHGVGFFDPMFSAFTVVAHPLLEERRRAIDPDRPSPSDAEGIEVPQPAG